MTQNAFGTGFFGKVDKVPGLFHKATLFRYALFFPMWPVETWIVLDNSMRREKIDENFWTNTETWETRWRGVKVPIDNRSVSAAYLRAGLFALGFLISISSIWWLNTGAEGLGMAGLVLSFISFVGCAAHTLFTKADISQAIEMAKVANINALTLARKLQLPENDFRIVAYREWRQNRTGNDNMWRTA